MVVVHEVGCGGSRVRRIMPFQARKSLQQQRNLWGPSIKEGPELPMAGTIAQMSCDCNALMPHMLREMALGCAMNLYASSIQCSSLVAMLAMGNRLLSLL